MNSNLKLLRHLTSELRQTSTGSVRDNLTLRYILDQFRKYKTTDQQLCKAQEEVKFIGDTYLCYLQSSRKYQEINQAYHAKGERSVEETAKLVGFKLPHDPK